MQAYASGGTWDCCSCAREMEEARSVAKAITAQPDRRSDGLRISRMAKLCRSFNLDALNTQAKTIHVKAKTIYAEASDGARIEKKNSSNKMYLLNHLNRVLLRKYVCVRHYAPFFLLGASAPLHQNK